MIFLNFFFGRLVHVTESLKHYGSKVKRRSFQDILNYKIRVELLGGIVPPIWCVDTRSKEWDFFMLNASYASIECEVEDNRVDLRQFITPLTGMYVTEDPAILNSELEYIVKETRQKPRAVVVSLSFSPPALFWLRHARTTVKNKRSNQNIIKRYDTGF